MSGLVNTEYFDSLTKQIDSIDLCADLNVVVAGVFKELEAQVAAIEAQILAYGPMLALLTAPTNPVAAITWISDFINNHLTLQLKPAITYVAQLAEILASIAALTTAIEDAATRIGSCSVTIPTIT